MKDLQESEAQLFDMQKMLFTQGGLYSLLDYPPHDMVLCEVEVKKFISSSIQKAYELGKKEVVKSNHTEEMNTEAELRKPKFMECNTCRNKPDSPNICIGCLHNRDLISKLQEKVDGKIFEFEVLPPR